MLGAWGRDRAGSKTYTYRSACLCRARLVKTLGSRVTPFSGFFALFFVLLQARNVAVREEEAVA